MAAFQVLAAGDSGVLIQAEARIDPEINAWCLAVADAARDRLSYALRDIVPGYCSVTFYFDPLRFDAHWFEQELASIAAASDPTDAGSGEQIEVPVCYGGEFGPDLDDVAAFAACAPEEVIGLHTARTYRVYLIGFVPGFAYMADVDPRIAAPRRRTPRTVVVPGSVAIAGAQTGIYPAPTPGGWNVVGRTPVAAYDATRAEPSLFKPGDLVRFVRIDADEFHDRDRNPTALG